MGNSSQKETDHPTLGKINISDQHGPPQMILRKLIPNKQQLSIWTSRYQASRSLNKTNLFLPFKQQVKKQGTCSSQYEIDLYFDYFPYSLESQIVGRYSARTPYTQKQMWYLLYSLIEPLYQFQLRNQKLGDIRPCNILINSQANIKLINSYSYPNNLTNYQIELKRQKEITYISPQQYEELAMGNKNPLIIPSLADIFSLGLTLLEAGLLSKSAYIYQNQNKVLNLDKLAQKKMELNKRYSPFLFKLIENMIEVNPKKRQYPGYFKAMLFPYKQQILNLMDFSPIKSLSQQSVLQYQVNRGRRVPYLFDSQILHISDQ